MRPRPRRPSPAVRAALARDRANVLTRLQTALAELPTARSAFRHGHPRGGCWEDAALAGEFGPDVRARTLAGDPCADFA